MRVLGTRQNGIHAAQLTTDTPGQLQNSDICFIKATPVIHMRPITEQMGNSGNTQCAALIGPGVRESQSNTAPTWSAKFTICAGCSCNVPECQRCQPYNAAKQKSGAAAPGAPTRSAPRRTPSMNQAGNVRW